MNKSNSFSGRAAVIGGGIAGLLAARALADYFAEVLVIEADGPCQDKKPRRRTPQGHHSHILLGSGQRVLEQLFPGLIQELIDDGSVVTDFINDLEWFHYGTWKRRFPSSFRGVQQTRPFLEWHLYRRMKDYRNITIKHHTLAVGFLMSADRKTVEGVKVYDENLRSEVEIECDLVIDASGSASRSLKWLGIEETGITETIDIDLFYATRYYCSDELLSDWKNMMILAKLPEQPYSGVVVSYENNRFAITLSGYGKQPPKTEKEFLKIAESLPQPHIYELIRQAIPAGDMQIYRIPHQTRKRLDKMNNLPGRLLMMGDSCCRLDPVFGQGMSVAALEAELLMNELKRITSKMELTTFHNKFNKKLIQLTQNPWDMAATEHFRHPGIAGKRPIELKVKQWLTARIYRASASDEDIYLRLAQVMSLTHSPSIFFHPSVLKKIFFTGKGREA